MSTAVPWHSAFSRRYPGVSLFNSPQFLLQCSPSFDDLDKVPVFVFELAQLFEELVDRRSSTSVRFLNHRDCDRVLVVVCGMLEVCVCSFLLSGFCVLGWSSSFVIG